MCVNVLQPIPQNDRILSNKEWSPTGKVYCSLFYSKVSPFLVNKIVLNAQLSRIHSEHHISYVYEKSEAKVQELTN